MLPKFLGANLVTQTEKCQFVKNLSDMNTEWKPSRIPLSVRWLPSFTRHKLCRGIKP